MENNFDFSELIKKVTENPEMLSKAMELASSLKESGAMGESAPTSAPVVPPIEEVTGEVLPKKDAIPTSNGIDMGNIMGLLSGSDKSKGNHDDKGDKHHKDGVLRNKKEHQKLLHALRPYLSKERSEKAELLVNILNMLELAEGMGIKLF